MMIEMNIKNNFLLGKYFGIQIYLVSAINELSLLVHVTTASFIEKIDFICHIGLHVRCLFS